MHQQAYATAHTGAVYLDRSAAGCVLITGRDRLAVIHRLSTNAVDALAPGAGQLTVFTNHNGRIIDLVSVLAIDDDSALVVTSGGRGGEIAALLQRNRFFNDQFNVINHSDEYGQLHVYGPQAAALLEQVGGVSDLAAVAPWHHVAAMIDGCTVHIQRIWPIHGQGWRVIADIAAVEAVGEALDEAGAMLLDPAAYTVLRIEAGQPDLPELNLEYIPLETNLWDAVSFKKGCYVGQEIIARMESRGRLAKKLTGVLLSAEVATPLTLTTPDAGKDAGTLTSVAYSPDLASWVGLAYVRSAFLAAGTTLQAAAVTATVAELPLVSVEHAL